MREPIQNESQGHHITFDDAMQEKAREQAEKLEKKASQTPNGPKKNELKLRANSYHEAISEIQGMTKAEVVEWIQENTGGKKSAEMEDAGEYNGVVYSRQTYCDVLSPWPELFKDVAGIIHDNYLLQRKNS